MLRVPHRRIVMLSVVIPVFNEENCLEESLRELVAQRGDFEVIVVDGGSTDRSREIVERFPDIRLVRSAKGRGKQMNAGARVARGETLLFLHADSRLEAADSLARIEAFIAEGCAAGCLRHRFDSRHPWLRLVSLLHNLRFRMTGIIYGDQGLVLRRDLFHGLGGFAEGTVMEDTEFSLRLRKVTAPKRFPLTCTTSARKFLSLGVFRATLRVLYLVAAFRLRRNVQTDTFFSDIR